MAPTNPLEMEDFYSNLDEEGSHEDLTEGEMYEDGTLWHRDPLRYVEMLDELAPVGDNRAYPLMGDEEAYESPEMPFVPPVDEDDGCIHGCTGSLENCIECQIAEDYDWDEEDWDDYLIEAGNWYEDD